MKPSSLRLDPNNPKKRRGKEKNCLQKAGKYDRDTLRLLAEAQVPPPPPRVSSNLNPLHPLPLSPLITPLVMSTNFLHTQYNLIYLALMASSSSSAAAASSSEYNERNRRANNDPPASAPPPPLAWPNDPPPRPPPEPHAVYVQELYGDPPHQRLFLRRDVSFLCLAAILGLTFFLVVASLSVLMWLVLHPTFPQLNVVSATMSAVTITSTAASADCNITFLLTNPNRHLKTIYDGMEISLLYPSHQVLLSHDYHLPFVQPRKTRTTIETNLGFNGDGLGIDVLKAMKHDLDGGSLSLEIKILAVVRYRNGEWKTQSQYMRAYCGGVSFEFTSNKNRGIFLNPYQECEVYLYTK